MKRESWRIVVTVEIDRDSVEDHLKLVQLKETLKEHGVVTTERARAKKEG